jgi:hypothetical protein
MPIPASRLPAWVSRPTEVVGEIFTSVRYYVCSSRLNDNGTCPFEKYYLYEVYEGDEVSEIDERHAIGFFYSIRNERAGCCHTTRAQ